MRNKAFFLAMSKNGLNYAGQLFDNSGDLKDWETIKFEFNLENKFYFSWLQLIDSTPVSWKRNIMDDKVNSINLCTFNCQIYVINRLNSKELYAMQNFCGNSEPASQIYFESFFKTTLDGKKYF